MGSLIKSNPDLYDRVRQLGVNADVWDEVIDELFDSSALVLDAFGRIAFDLNDVHEPKWLDYSRQEGISDHTYVCSLLKPAMEQVLLTTPLHPELPPNDGSDCDAALEAYYRDPRNIEKL